MVHSLLAGTIVLSMAYLIVTFLLALSALVINMVAGRRERDEEAEDPASLAVSRFTIPVSILVPACNEATLIVPCIESLLDLNYPEFEVIVVSDGSTDGTIDRLKEAFDIRPREIFYRKLLPSGEVRKIHRGTRDSRLVVVDKDHGGKADALNCGINLARYRYVCTVAADTVYDRDALLKAMPAAIKDPASVLGVTSHVDVRVHPPSHQTDRGVDRNVLSNFQHLERLRWLMNNRLVWSRLHFRLGSARAFGIWRRDALLDVGGFATDLSGEEIDITFKVQEKYAKHEQPGRVVALSVLVGRTEAADRFSRLIRQRARWQRVVWESVWRYRHMFARSRFGQVGWIGFPYFIVTQILTPFIHLLAMIVWPLGWWAGLMTGTELIRLLGIVAFGNGIMVSSALLMEESKDRMHGLLSLSRLVLLGPIEPFFYRPAILVARVRGAWEFATGERAWHRSARNGPAEA